MKEGTLDVPPGTACARLGLEAGLSGRGFGLDAVEWVPLEQVRVYAEARLQETNAKLAPVLAALSAT